MSGMRDPARWAHTDKLTGRKGPMANEEFEPDAEAHRKFLTEDSKVLVIGAGGLGCELLKDLALAGFRNIDVIDMDTIDYSNLNRQFLFRKPDVGKPKATCAAEFINKRVTGCNVTPHFARIEDMDDDYYRQFHVIIAGLDAIEPRRWINSLLLSFLDFDEDGEIEDPEAVIPLIDGGTEGFKGQARVILPGISSCFECSLDLFPPQVTYPMCTIADKPRQPEHCIEFAKQVLWPRDRPDDKFDADDAEHLQWMFEQSLKRAQEFNIEGVTLRLTKGVVKNIIPAVASTNAVIAAACVNEAFKIATLVSDSLNNYYYYNAVGGLYTHTMEYERKDDCLICGQVVFKFEVSKFDSLGRLVELLADHEQLKLKKPSIRGNNKSLYMQAPESLKRATEANLQKPMGELFDHGCKLDVMDPSLFNTAVQIVISFSDA
jgi:ubiquitin-activating enzyme E1 C